MVTVASVSTDFVGSPCSSTFKRTWIPAFGDHTLTDIFVLLAVKGILVEKPNSAAAVTVVPAHNSAAAVLITLATLLAALVGSATIDDCSAPPNPIKP